MFCQEIRSLEGKLGLKHRWNPKLALLESYVSSSGSCFQIPILAVEEVDKGPGGSSSPRPSRASFFQKIRVVGQGHLNAQPEGFSHRYAPVTVVHLAIFSFANGSICLWHPSHNALLNVEYMFGWKGSVGR